MYTTQVVNFFASKTQHHACITARWTTAFECRFLPKNIRDAHERENLVRTNPEQMLTCSNGEERSEHIGLWLGLILWNTKTGRVQQIPVISFEKIPKGLGLRQGLGLFATFVRKYTCSNAQEQERRERRRTCSPPCASLHPDHQVPRQ